jgi:hypothetical protein
LISWGRGRGKHGEIRNDCDIEHIEGELFMKKILFFIVIVVCTGGGLLLGNKLKFNILGIFGRNTGADIISSDTTINITSTVKEILPGAEYACLVYHYSSVITDSNVKKLFGFNVPLSEKKAIYTIDGTIKLGFDCKNITIENQYDNIILNMPKIIILSHEIYPETFSLYDEKTSLFNRYGLKDANDIQLEHKKEMEEKIKSNPGLFTQARQSAEQQFRLFLESIPEIRDKYTIVFEWEI